MMDLEFNLLTELVLNVEINVLIKINVPLDQTLVQIQLHQFACLDTLLTYLLTNVRIAQNALSLIVILASVLISVNVLLAKVDFSLIMELAPHAQLIVLHADQPLLQPALNAKTAKKLDLTTAAPTYCTTACSATSSTTTNWCKIEANGTTKTIGCKSGYVENTNKDDCITCSATNCVTCVANDGAKCATCKDNYFANASGVCTLCENTKVKTCTTATAALTCASGSCLGGAGGDKCFTCPANCVKTTGSTALTASTANTDLTIDGKCSTANLSCVAGYYKDASDVC